MIKFCEYVLKDADKKAYKELIKKHIHINHYQENEIFAGHFNPVFEGIWVIAKEYFSKPR